MQTDKSNDQTNVSTSTVANAETKAAREGVFISTYGCQMNVHDTDRMHALLEMINIEQVGRPEDASVIIINSCSVREKAVHKVHSEAGRYRKLKNKNPNLKIGVGGCVGQQEKGNLLKDVPVLDFVFGTDTIDKLPQIVQEVRKQNTKITSARFDHVSPYQIETLIKNPGVATFVNIMKGCDNFCTFCVVPFTRGRERSRNIEEIIQDVQKLTLRGVKEVTLIGQNVNSYKSDHGEGFGDLLLRLTKETNLERIRYTTPHPKDFNIELAHIMRDHREKIMEYIHLPAQSGNTEILERMNRGYTREEYLAKAKMLQSEVPGATFSTDLIVGFPGETEAQFEDTLSLLDEVPFESIYAFKYSPRPFTKAAKFLDQVPEDIKSERLTRLFAKHREIAHNLTRKYEGATLRVLVEEYHESDGGCFGRSTQNKSIHFKGSPELVGQTVNVKINCAYPSTLHGEIV
ncbi:MAG: tRNA (N6-isopentenyl adenosine(37)-C2)-methylthiotransferase MiaB [Bdellovibrionales bacterium]|nr:tRNA (N6-isopentenyl adenosine(37)-C2)-methylthiotransferase MiaB [Bdellovibrionales bacterium]